MFIFSLTKAAVFRKQKKVEMLLLKKRVRECGAAFPFQKWFSKDFKNIICESVKLCVIFFLVGWYLIGLYSKQLWIVKLDLGVDIKVKKF